jgi:huntingtin
MYREKIEKLALDLMKTENKLYSVGGLKLLVTCLYTGSLEQLENTEKSNGIVQDEPEILMQSTEKIEILFTRIRTATLEEAEIYGRVLGQILKDLLPPNEILTKVIKELLIMNQSNCVCIATIIHQVCENIKEICTFLTFYYFTGFPISYRFFVSDIASRMANLFTPKLSDLPQP